MSYKRLPNDANVYSLLSKLSTIVLRLVVSYSPKPEPVTKSLL